MKANGKIRAGIIGIGNWGRYGHVPVLQLLPKFEIAAVASRRQAAAQQLAREFNIAHAFVDADELINHPDIDLIIVLPRLHSTPAMSVPPSRRGRMSTVSGP